MKGVKAVWMMALLVLSFVPVYTVTAGETSTTTTSTSINQTLNASVNATQVAAEVMLRNLERLQNYTSTLINQTENVSEDVMETYEKALNLTEEAKALYENGSYKESLRTAILAMKAYRDVIRGIRTEEVPELVRERVMARIEAMRMMEYFKHVEMLINAARMHRLNVTNLTRLYNETYRAYRRVLDDVMTNNTTAMGPDLERARELRRQLDGELERLQMKFALKKADEIARAFDRRIQMMVMALQRLRNVPGTNNTIIDNMTRELNQLRIRVDQLVREGKYLGALHLIKEATPKLVKSAIHLRWIHKDHTIYWAVGRGTGHHAENMTHHTENMHPGKEHRP